MDELYFKIIEPDGDMRDNYQIQAFQDKKD